MDSEDIYENVPNNNSKDTPGPRTQNHSQDEGKDGKCRGRWCLVLTTVCLGLICVILLVFITLQYINITYLTETNAKLIKDPGQVFFSMSNEEMNWSESRQYCRDREADLVIIHTEEKQKFISSFIKERVWIGLSDENKSNLTWVDNSLLNHGFWDKGEPNSLDENCIELDPGRGPVKNWNDLQCSQNIKCICEK
ncbi:hypothetical protein R3I93_005658 [Phoxinus phoxinus]|uniref:C-type lectin domain-containing protein n=1 Tax=Phoxinus phoxinus TaxID=58324 RepID=A0AAN9D8H2_9TELE